MKPVSNYANLVAAIDESKGLSSKGYTFLDRDQQERFFSFEQLREEAMRRAAHFRQHGLKKGDRLAMVIPEGEDFVPTFLAAVWAGIIPVPLYPPLSLGKLDAYLETLVGILNKAKPTHVATTAKLQQVLWSGLAKVPSLEGVITAEELKGDAPEGVSQAPEHVSDNDICFLQFTSGSTSTPKGVAVTHQNIRANVDAIMKEGLKIDPEVDHGVSWLPLYHDMGLIGFVIGPMLYRIPVTFIPTMAFVRNATIWLETIHRVRGTITFAPNFAYALTAKRAKPEQIARWNLSSLRAFGCGAEPINPVTVNKFVDTFSTCGIRPEAMLPSYGMAEATLAISFIGLDERLTTDVIDSSAYQKERQATPVDAAALKSGLAQEFVCCGRPFAGHDIAIFDDHGVRLAERHIGEIWVRGPSVAQGYYQDAEASDRIFGGGWLKTGDYGYLVDGQVFITGRKKDIIIINGRNYDPQRIEWMVDEIPEVRKGSTVAFSRPGLQSEELIIVLESRTENLAAMKEAVALKVSEQMQMVAADVMICPVGSLPKTSSGKLQRAKTRQQYLDGSLGREGVRTLGSNADRFVLARHVAISVVARARHRARKAFLHTTEIRSVGDAFEKLKLARTWAQKRVPQIFG
jgi:fatty-acyl-CoA synthase